MHKNGQNLLLAPQKKLKKDAKMVMLLWLLFCGITLTGCDLVTKSAIQTEIPRNLLSCKKPDTLAQEFQGETVTQADAAVVQTDIYLAWEDCYDTLHSLADLLEKVY